MSKLISDSGANNTIEREKNDTNFFHKGTACVLAMLLLIDYSVLHKSSCFLVKLSVPVAGNVKIK